MKTDFEVTLWDEDAARVYAPALRVVSKKSTT